MGYQSGTNLPTRHVVQDLQAESLDYKLWRDKEGALRAGETPAIYFQHRALTNQSCFVTGEKRSKIVKWLCSTTHESRHVDIQAERKDGTGKWLLETGEFKRWKEEKAKSRLLWGRGIRWYPHLSTGLRRQC
jgi:hypothetical protein